MQFDDTRQPPEVEVYAVIAEGADEHAVRVWLGDVARRLDPDLGVVADIHAGTRSQVSLEFIENSYSADLTQLTWGGYNPVGAI